MQTSLEIESICDLTIFIACYNEEAGIVPSIEVAVAAATAADLTFDIVIIDDASNDNSVNLVRQFISARPELPIALYAAEINQGFGSNYAEAAFRGRGKYYAFIPGDNVVPKETLVAIFQHIGEADMLLPYPTVTNCRGPGRRALSWTFTRLINLISGHHIKYYNGAAVHLRYNVMRWHSYAHGFGFLADLTTRLLDMGATYVEIPIVPHEREDGSSKALTLQNLGSVGHTLIDLFARRVGKLFYRGKYSRRLSRMSLFVAATSSSGTVVTSNAEISHDTNADGPCALNK